MAILQNQEAKILELYKEGLPIYKIARSTGLSDYKVKKFLVSRGEFSPVEKKPATSELPWDDAINWYLNGMSRREVAEKLGVSTSTVGLQFRRKHVFVATRNKFLSRDKPPVDEILRLLRKGLSLNRISQLMKCPRISVDRAYWAYQDKKA